MNEKLPVEGEVVRDTPRGGGARYLSIGTLHYHGNDLAELRKIAEVSPELANKIVDQRDKEDSRANTSYRFGIVSSALLVSVALGAFSFLLLEVGVIPTLCAIGGVLAVALLIRVILTGEWSDTSWFGKLMHMLVKALGGKPQDSGAE